MAENSELGLPWIIYDSADPLHQKIKGNHRRIGGMHIADVLGVEQAAYITFAANHHHALVKGLDAMCCEDCPPIGHITDATRCKACPRGANGALTALKEANNV